MPPLGLSLKLDPVLEDAEFADSWYTPAAYWQGAVRVSGTHREGPVQGRRFMELVGYGPQQLKQTPAL